MTRLVASAVLAVALLGRAAPSGEPPGFEFRREAGKLTITHDGKPVATYVHGDAKIRRPYFAHLHEPGGAQVTRNHPPVAGKDPTDHADFHPGLWLAFGDLSGADSWRIKAPVVHERFVEEPKGGMRGGFAVRNRYLGADGKKAVCAETCRYTFVARAGAYLILWDSTFTAEDGDVTFGDQEEMGLGIRVAAPLAVDRKEGGRITDSAGRVNGKAIWGKQADWCDYTGKLGGRAVGVTLMPDPKNPRPSRFHARDYGLLAANPFAVAAFKAGPENNHVLRKGESLRLRFGVLLHGGADVPVAYRDFLERLAR